MGLVRHTRSLPSIDMQRHVTYDESSCVRRALRKPTSSLSLRSAFGSWLKLAARSTNMPSDVVTGLLRISLIMRVSRGPHISTMFLRSGASMVAAGASFRLDDAARAIDLAGRDGNVGNFACPASVW